MTDTSKAAVENLIARLERDEPYAPSSSIELAIAMLRALLAEQDAMRARLEALPRYDMQGDEFDGHAVWEKEDGRYLDRDEVLSALGTDRDQSGDKAQEGRE